MNKVLLAAMGFISITLSHASTEKAEVIDDYQDVLNPSVSLCLPPPVTLFLPLGEKEVADQEKATPVYKASSIFIIKLTNLPRYHHLLKKPLLEKPSDQES